eukprot:TRINITY_DN11761_c0_g1_i8.p1 TRINITY_DN11761_c0_g1~~TRINITY_DN11761_c0_g1_i8.p1  ORF type:complete len:409 (+),score=39.77 TRINITY_DN11761_c0_g1_i8:340-1566(+)
MNSIITSTTLLKKKNSGLYQYQSILVVCLLPNKANFGAKQSWLQLTHEKNQNSSTVIMMIKPRQVRCFGIVLATSQPFNQKKGQTAQKSKRISRQSPQPRQFSLLEKGILSGSAAAFTISGFSTFFNPNLIVGLLSKPALTALDRVQTRVNSGSLLSYAALLTVLYLLRSQEDSFSQNAPKNIDSLMENFQFQILFSVGLVICSLILFPVSVTFKSQGYITDDLFFTTIFCSGVLFFCGIYEIITGGKRAQQLNAPWGIGAAIQNIKDSFSLISLLNKRPYDTVMAFSAWEGIILVPALVLSPFSVLVGFISNVETDFFRRIVGTGSVAVIFFVLGALVLSEKESKDTDAFKWFNYALFLPTFIFSIATIMGLFEGVEFIGPNFSVVSIGILQSFIPLYAALKQEFKK